MLEKNASNKKRMLMVFFKTMFLNDKRFNQKPSNSVGTQLLFLGCNQDNNGGSNFITKKENLLDSPEKEISNHRN